ncbi:uncharacterized protein LOC120350458 [Nilaparvata lugens]|uniref:uncharacterized protein LOC120350458 n=1 Tax=Nilaparvata lugens TaxID=108931 RepID=UPI00193E74C1|nr:uncharacterized protein LOC120350458 [Nilaparvata lugens]
MNEYISSTYWICQLHSSTSHIPVSHILVIMDSSSTHQEYILPYTPPQQSTSFPSYRAAQAAQQKKKKLPTTTTTAAPAAASDCKESPLKSRGVIVERGLSSEEIIVPDTPPSHLEWVPRCVPLTMISNKQQGKRNLRFLEEDEGTIFVPSKKQRAYEAENSSITPLLEEVEMILFHSSIDRQLNHGCLSASWQKMSCIILSLLLKKQTTMGGESY